MGNNRFKKKSVKKKRQSFGGLRLFFKGFAVVCLILVLSGAFIFVYELFIQSDYFKADTIVVHGANRLSRAQVMDQVDIKSGMNILAVNLSVARKRLLAHSWVSEAGVKRKLPSGLIITIREHSPLAIVDIGKRYLVNTNWEVFKELEPVDPYPLPVIRGLSVTHLYLPGGKKNKQFKAVMTVLTLGKSPASIIPIKAIKTIQVDKEMGVTVFAFERIRAIKLGYGDYLGKYERLRNVLFFLDQTDRLTTPIEWIDMNNPDRIVISPQAGSAA